MSKLISIGKKQSKRTRRAAPTRKRIVIRPKPRKDWLLSGTALVTGSIVYLAASAIPIGPAWAACVSGSGATFVCDDPAAGLINFTPTAPGPFDADFEDDGFITNGNPAFRIENDGDFDGTVDFETAVNGINSNNGHAFELDNDTSVSSSVTISMANGVEIVSSHEDFDAMRLEGDIMVLNVGTSVPANDADDARITGGDDGIVATIVHSSLTINNYGEIEGGNQGADLTNGGAHEAILIAANGTPGQLVEGDVTINNYNLIHSQSDTDNGVGGQAISISTEGDVDIQNNADATIEGTQGGIRVEGDGTNAVNIDNAGHIEGFEGDGIELVNVGDVTGTNSSLNSLIGTDGIEVDGANSFYWDNTGGFIQGTDDEGIDLDNIDNQITIINGGDGQIVGYWDGIDIDEARGGILIDNQNGTIEGGYENDSSGGAGIDISDVDSDSGDSIRILNNGDAAGANAGVVRGDGYGIEMDEISTEMIVIDNSLGGSITGDEEEGINIDTVNFEGGNGALNILNQGNATVAGGTIFGEDDGIRLDEINDGNILINNSFGGTITGAEGSGVEITDTEGGDVVVDNRDGGSIDGNDEDGVKIEEVDDNGTGGGNVIVYNDRGTIEGLWDGVDIEDIDHDVTVTNQGGTITGQNAQGVDISDVWDGGVFVDNSHLGVIQGGDTGVSIENVEGGVPGGLDGVLVDNSYGGTITGQTGDGVKIEEIDNEGLLGGVVTVLNHGGVVNGVTETGGTITGYWDGVDIEDVDNDVLVDNSYGGTIVGENAQGVDISDVWDGGVHVLNSNGGSITGLEEGVLIEDIRGGVVGGFNGVLVDNSYGGTITGTDDDGVHIEEIDEEDSIGGVVTVLNSGGVAGSGGTITGQDDGVDIEDVDHDVYVDNRYGGSITGTEGQGVDISDVWDGNVLVDNSEGGHIESAQSDAVRIENINGNVEVRNVNSPTSIVGYWDGVDIEDVEGTVLVDNDGGSITGLHGQGVDIDNIDDSVTVSNIDGTILGDDDGVRIEDIWKDGNVGLVLVDNSGAAGTITGTNGDGVSIEEVDNLDVTVLNGGNITGYWDGVDIEDVDDGLVTVTNLAGGTITGQNASAVDVSEANEDVTINNAGSLLGVGDHEGDDQAVVEIETRDAAYINNQAGGLIAGHNMGTPDYAANLEDWEVLAISTETNDGTFVENYGTIIGRVDFRGGTDDVFNNYSNDSWNTSGTSDFGGGYDVVDNTGTINIRDRARFRNLEYLHNDGGLINMIDGDIEERLRLTDNESEYEGTGNARLAIDVHFGQHDDPDTGADRFRVDGDIEGSTGLVVNGINTMPGGINTWGIDFASYGDWTPGCSGEDGLCVEGDTFYIHPDSKNFFKLGDLGGVEDGFFAWFARHDDEYNDYELVSTWGPGAINAPGIITGAQHIFYETANVVEDHRFGHQMNGVAGGAGADLPEVFYEPTPTPSYGERSGLWARASGSWIEHENDVEVMGMDFGAGSDQSIFSLLGGADMKPWGADSPVRIGLFGGYVTSNLDFDLGTGEVDYEGGVVGAYAAYNTGTWYADVTVKGDILDAEYSVGGIDADADVTNIGFLANAGYRFHFGGGFIEPIASLGYVHTDVDDMDDGGASVSFDEGDSLRAGVGARVGTSFASWGGTSTELSLLGKVWNEFEDANTVTVSDGMGNTASFSDDIEGVFGEVSATAVMTSADGTLSGFVSAGGQFGDEFTSWNAKAGVRKGF